MLETKVRRLSIITSVLATLMAFLGVILGALWLAAHWGLYPLLDIYPIHPDLMINGFLLLFIMSVAFILVPRFRNKRFEWVREAYASVSLIILGNLVLVSWSLAGFPPSWYGLLLVLTGSLIFSQRVVRILGWPSGVLAVADPYILLSVIILPLTLAARMITEAGYSNPAYLHLAILGFPTLMIFGVMTRTVHFRVATLRKNLVKPAFIFTASAAALSLIATLSWSSALFTASSTLYLVGGLLFIFGVDGFRVVRSGEQYSRMRERDRVRYDYFSVCFAGAMTWLTAGLILGLAYASSLYMGEPVFSLRDGFIHAVAVGFIATTIMAYGPIMLPPLLSSHTPYKGLTLTPVALVWVGNIWRIAGFILRDYSNVYLEINGLSSIPIVAGLLYFLLMTHRLRD